MEGEGGGRAATKGCDAEIHKNFGVLSEFTGKTAGSRKGQTDLETILAAANHATFNTNRSASESDYRRARVSAQTPRAV